MRSSTALRFYGICYEKFDGISAILDTFLVGSRFLYNGSLFDAYGFMYCQNGIFLNCQTFMVGTVQIWHLT